MESIFLDIHILFGSVALLSLSAALISKKNGALHKNMGICSAIVIIISLIGAMAYISIIGNFFLFPICLQTVAYVVIGLCAALGIKISEKAIKLFKIITYINVAAFFTATTFVMIIAKLYDNLITQASFFVFAIYIIRRENLKMLLMQRYHSVLMIQVAISVVSAFLISTVKPNVFFITAPVIIVINWALFGIAAFHLRKIKQQQNIATVK